MDKVNLRIVTTITDNQVEELIQHSNNDKDVIKYTSDSTRFRDRETFDSWLKENPTIHILTNNTERLLGVAWVQKMTNPLIEAKFDTTAAIRLYGEARGKGLSSWFLREALQKYGDMNYWLRTSNDNVSAKRTYEKLGFKIVTPPDKENKVILTRHSDYSSLQ